jgi:hypothetical protein
VHVGPLSRWAHRSQRAMPGTVRSGRRCGPIAM